MMKKLLALSMFFVVGIANASEQVEYSTEGFCNLSQVLNRSIQQKAYQKAYAEKLGNKPSKSMCQSIRAEKFANKKFQPENWDYRFNRASRGSVLRFSPNTIKKLRSNRIKSSDIYSLRQNLNNR